MLLFTSIASIFILTYSNKSTELSQEIEESKTLATENSPVALLSASSFKVMSFASTSSTYVSQTVTATIYPSTVGDKYVTWSIAWDSSASLKNEDISKYLQIADGSQGNLTCTINCFKSFRGSKALLSCTTRQGGKTTTVDVVYSGKPSSLTIDSPSGIAKYNLGKDSVDLLSVGSSYSLNLEMDNIFHDVGSNITGFSIAVSGVGTVQCGTHSTSPRGQAWDSSFNTVDFSSIAKKFVSCSILNNTLSINVTKNFYDYYESSSTKYTEQIGDVTTYTNKLYSLNVDSDGNLPYFIVTVSHEAYDISSSYKFFIGAKVESVSTNVSTITF